MSRVHYFSFLVDDYGHPLSGAKVSIFLAGTETPAKLFDTEFGSVYTLEAPQLITTTKGFFEFWVSDLESPDGYPYGQKFKISWEKPGVSSGYIDWIDIFPSVYHVDETNFESSVKNKLVSDRLAFNWETHSNHDVRTDFFPIHGMESFNPKGDEDTIKGTFTPEHNLINKIISDKFAYIWDNHTEFTFEDMILTSGTSFTSASSATSAASGDFDSNPDIYNTTAHGLQPATFNNDDIYYNKLVSNEFMTKFASRNGVQSFTHPVSGIYPSNSNHLTTKKYVDYIYFERLLKTINRKTFIIEDPDWTWDPTKSQYYYICEHGFNEEYPNAIIWNNDTNKLDNNYDINSLNYNQIIIYSDTITNLSVIIDNNIITEDLNISQRHFKVSDFGYAGGKYFITINYEEDILYPYVQVWDYNNKTIDYDNVIYKNSSNQLIIKFDSPLECIVNISSELFDNSVNITTSDWSESGGIYSKQITHNLNTLTPNIYIWNVDLDRIIDVYNIESVDENTILIESVSLINIKVSFQNNFGDVYNYINYRLSNSVDKRGDIMEGILDMDNNTISNVPTPISSDQAVNKGYVDGLSTKIIIDNTSWTYTTSASSGPGYEKTITHNLNEEYPNIAIWNTDTNKIQEVNEIISINENNIKIISGSELNLLIKVNK